jgi:hypothetical protein
MDPLTLQPCATRLRWRFPEPQPLERWQTLFAAFLDRLALDCDASGPYVIGHIKGLVLLPGGGYLRGSKVSTQYAADVEVGRSTRTLFKDLELELQVLVYGLPLPEAQRIVQEAGQALAQNWNAELEVIVLSSVQELAAGDHDHD